MTAHEQLYLLAALLLAAAGFISTTPTLPAVLLAGAGAAVACCGMRVQGLELAALGVRA